MPLVNKNNNKKENPPLVVPYSKNFTEQEFDKYNKFYQEFSRAPLNKKDDKFDAFYHEQLKNVRKEPEYFTGWVKEFPGGRKEYVNTQPKESSKYKVKKVENEIIGYDYNSNDINELTRRLKTYSVQDKKDELIKKIISLKTNKNK
jgi:hypothetical protein